MRTARMVHGRRRHNGLMCEYQPLEKAFLFINIKWLLYTCNIYANELYTLVGFFLKKKDFYPNFTSCVFKKDQLS